MAGRTWRKEVRFWVILSGLGLLLGFTSAVPGDFDIFALHEGPSAAIIDQLSLTAPNASFVAGATRIMETSGYHVDYYQGEEVTVDLYRQLPRLGYDIVVLRTHSTAQHANGVFDDVVMFTNEDYQPYGHVWDQYQAHVSRVAYTPDATQQESLFGVWPDFFQKTGDFDGALVFMMGCQGTSNASLAEVFLEAGADAYVGWNTMVTADRTDTGTLAFLEQHLNGTSIVDSVWTTNRLIGEDEEYGSKLNAVGERDAMV